MSKTTKIKITDSKTDDKILNKTFVSSLTYKIQNQYSDTVNLENTTIENLINKIYNELLIKFNSDQDREMTSRIDQRMDVVRQRAIIKESTSSLIVGMTIPDIQSLLGQPKDIIQKKDKEGSSIQLWIYPLEDGGEMYLSFKDYILFKIEKDA